MNVLPVIFLVYTLARMSHHIVFMTSPPDRILQESVLRTSCLAGSSRSVLMTSSLGRVFQECVFRTSYTWQGLPGQSVGLHLAESFRGVRKDLAIM